MSRTRLLPIAHQQFTLKRRRVGASKLSCAQIARPPADAETSGSAFKVIGARPAPLLDAALDALSAHVAVLDTKGIVVAVNQAWRRFGIANGLKLANSGIGTDYLAVIARAGSAASSVYDHLRRVLQGRSVGFIHQYCCPGPNGELWFQMQVRRFGRSTGRGVLVAHEDITELKAAEKAIRQLADQLAQSREAERRQLASEIHNTTGQELLVVSLGLMRLERLLQRHGQEGHEVLIETQDALARAQRDLRTMSYLLHSPAIAGVGLSGAMRALVQGFARRTGIKARFATNYRGTSSEQVERAILSVAQEALINVYRHSGSRTARVRLRAMKDRMTLDVTDQGRWIAAGEGVGVASMRETIRQVGGSLNIIPSARGTQVHAVVPKSLPARASARRAHHQH
jgi:two-component system, NarL family, sensor kinase